MSETSVDLTPRTRVVGAQRTAVTGKIARRYTDGASIRTIARDLGRGYGFVHKILTESGVRFRPRGGGGRRRAPSPARTEAREHP